MNYATDGKCHNAQPGTFGHECGKPAQWVGAKASGFKSGFCSDCKEHGHEARACMSWEPYKAIEPLEWKPLWDAMDATPDAWIPTTEDMYWELLECVPPRAFVPGCFLVGEAERIESGAYRIIAADSGLGDCLVMRIPPEKSSYSFVSTLRIELEPIPEAKRVPLKTI